MWFILITNEYTATSDLTDNLIKLKDIFERCCIYEWLNFWINEEENVFFKDSVVYTFAEHDL